jgi:hypothetical protein
MTVPPPAVSLSLWWQIKLAGQKVCPGLRNVSLKRHVHTVLVEKMLQFKLPAAHSFCILTGKAQGLTLSVLLRHAAIFGHE